MKVFDKIVFSPFEPPLTNAIWARPIGDGFAFYLFDGKWKPLKVVDAKDTYSPSDDSIIDLDNIPSLDNLDDRIEGEVSRQIQEHDVGVNDVHFAPQPTDGKEYPNVMIFDSGD